MTINKKTPNIVKQKKDADCRINILGSKNRTCNYDYNCNGRTFWINTLKKKFTLLPPDLDENEKWHLHQDMINDGIYGRNPKISCIK